MTTKTTNTTAAEKPTAAEQARASFGLSEQSLAKLSAAGIEIIIEKPRRALPKTTVPDQIEND